jgi:hypothetical protein
LFHVKDTLILMLVGHFATFDAIFNRNIQFLECQVP